MADRLMRYQASGDGTMELADSAGLAGRRLLLALWCKVVGTLQRGLVVSADIILHLGTFD